MMLVDIQSKKRTPLVVNLQRQAYNSVPSHPGTIVKRNVRSLDPVSGEHRVKAVAIHCPPVLTFPPRGKLVGLPATVLQDPQIQQLTRRRSGQPTLIVVRSYDPSPPADESASTPARRRSKTKKSRT